VKSTLDRPVALSSPWLRSYVAVLGTLDLPLEVMAEVILDPAESSVRAREMAHLAGGPRTSVVLRANLDGRTLGHLALVAWDESGALFEMVEKTGYGSPA
jgi:hypothetical protein